VRFPEDLRPLLGNRIYGCDDCQLVCPWNRYAQVTAEPDFDVRNGLDAAALVDLFAWSESEFDERLAAARSAGSATSAGCATSPSRSATRRRRRTVVARCGARGRIRRRWSASTSHGRWRSTALRAVDAIAPIALHISGVQSPSATLDAVEYAPRITIRKESG
jgi:hypothetical protein